MRYLRTLSVFRDCPCSSSHLILSHPCAVSALIRYRDLLRKLTAPLHLASSSLHRITAMSSPKQYQFIPSTVYAFKEGPDITILGACPPCARPLMTCLMRTPL